ncbi:biotin/lipoyl-containing protein [Streptomyces albogriseolus]|uniref:biotin/lipoyl-containing protein n=1 Tax=Streptomyces albogriseolus TaxID=1887 RepID=UPI0036FCCA8D
MVLPSLAGSEAATITQLAKPVGAAVRHDDLLLVVTADDVTFEVTSPIDGILMSWYVEPGATAGAGTRLASLSPAQDPSGTSHDGGAPETSAAASTGTLANTSPGGRADGTKAEIPEVRASETNSALSAPEEAAPGAGRTREEPSAAEETAPDRGTATAPPREAASDTSHEAADETADEGDGYSEEEWRPSKGSGTAYVTPSIAQKVQEMQQRGYTAEAIVLTAVSEANDRMAELIRKARGPVHEGGLFPGLPVVEKRGGPGRKAKVERADARLQYQISPEYLPALAEIAKRHKLRRSTLVRLSLGNYFDLPVRVGRTR